MTNPTTPFSWQMPTSTDLVTDLPADFAVFGQAVATSMADLLGGTTGQVLSKASNTDMDFTWVAQDDSNAIQNAIVDAKGDLIAASAADTPARLAVGNNGETLVADSSTSTGLRYQPTFAAGKNAVINGAFNVWQRGTSFSANGFSADRFLCESDTTYTVSRQTFTPGAAPVLGYESEYFLQFAKNSGGTYLHLSTNLEDVRLFAGQTVTLSAWMRVTSGTASVEPSFGQFFGSGGSSTVFTNGTAQTITSTWARYFFTVALPSISGKTIGSSSYLKVYLPRIITGATGAVTAQIWGIQLEAGSVATAFQTATGTIQGELAACRYYYNELGGVSDQYFATGLTYSTTVGEYALTYPPMRTTPSASISAAGDFKALNGSAAVYTNTAISFAYLSATSAAVNATIGTANFVVGQASIIKAGNANARIKLSAEL